MGKMYDNIDSGKPDVKFKDSQYYKQKRHLDGMMGPKELNNLKKTIKQMGDENRKDKYELSQDSDTRFGQVRPLVGNMQDSVMASRLEQLLLSDHESVKKVYK